MTTFHTPGPITLAIRGRSGPITARTDEDTTTTSVQLTALNPAGEDLLDRVTVDQRGDAVAVHVPKGGGGLLRGSPQIAIDVSCPADSSLEVKVDSGDVLASGRWAEAKLGSGSGDLDIEDVTGVVRLSTGSGQVSVGTADTVRASTGSGDVNVEATRRTAGLSTGSGSVSIGQVEGEVVAKTGSGDVEVGILVGSLQAKTGSGDLTVRRATSGEVVSRGASGQIDIGISEGTAAWLDISTMTGRVVQELGEVTPPGEGQPSVSITAGTVSGDIRIHRA